MGSDQRGPDRELVKGRSDRTRTRGLYASAVARPTRLRRRDRVVVRMDATPVGRGWVSRLDRFSDHRGELDRAIGEHLTRLESDLPHRAFWDVNGQVQFMIHSPRKRVFAELQIARLTPDFVKPAMEVGITTHVWELSVLLCRSSDTANRNIMGGVDALKADARRL
jgi:hypothetical protein